jgi:uncharacterized protein YcaQ
VSSGGVPRLAREQVVRLWLDRQGLLRPRGRRLTRRALVEHLERTGGLQLDSVNVVDRAHYLTLWSRFGPYDRETVDRWIYRDRVAYEFIAHEACIEPLRRLPLSRRYMREFDPQSDWWRRRKADIGVRRAVLRRIRGEGPLESADFKNPSGAKAGWWSWKIEKMALEWLFRRGRLAVSDRRSFRRVYDLAERVYPPGPAASRREWEDSWLLQGLAANGVATEAHLAGYLTAPRLSAADRRAILARNLKRGRVREVAVDGLPGAWFALAETLDDLGRLPRPRGTNLLCPFDSLLWQRRRAEDLLDFRYRVEIYVPPPRRVHGYYVLPILHEGRLVGRLDPKYDRQAGRLVIRRLQMAPGFDGGADFRRGLAGALTDLAAFLGAGGVDLPAGWRGLS